MTKQDFLRRVIAWLSDLANLTAGTHPLADAKAKIAAYASLLVEQFPPEAFTRQSLEHIARANRFFPAYAELVGPLSEWWRDNRPRTLAIGSSKLGDPGLPPQRREQTDEERAAVASAAAQAIALMNADEADRIAGEPKRPQERPTARYLSREQLNTAYAAAGLTGPQTLSVLANAK